MYKKLCLCGIPVLLTLFLTFANANAFGNDPRFSSNLFTQMEPSDEVLTQFNDSLVAFERVAENENLALYVDMDSLAIKVVNQATGYVWSSTLDEIQAHQLNQTWQHFVDAALTISVMDQSGSTFRESLTSYEATIDFVSHDDGFVADVVFGRSGIAMQLSVQLDGVDVVVSVLDDSLVEPEGFQLVSLQVYPFLGATKEDTVPGYMFIPDGAGALIRYGQQDVQMETPFRATVYGNDWGIGGWTRSMVNDPFNVAMPVFGMVHGVNQNAILAIIESGDNYAELLAHTAGLFTEFNWITAEFHYRYAYRQPTTRDEDRGPTVEMMQEERSVMDVTLRYRILGSDAANYVGMARAYQDYLIDIGVLSPLEASGAMMRLEFLGSEMAEGLLWNRVVPMTPITDIPDFIDALKQEGLADLLVVYKGWSRGGLSNSLPNRFPFERRLGTKADVGEVVDQLALRNIPMYFHTDYTNTHRRSGFFANWQPALQINTREMPFSHLIPEQALTQAKDDAPRFAEHGMQHLAIEATASYLNSVHNPGFEATRADNRKIVDELITTLNEGDRGRSALYQPNAYAWQHTNHYFNIPMRTSGYLFTTDTVPFLHIVLSGHMNYYAPVSNFSANSRQELLRMIDFGARPSFLLTSEPSHLLADTPSRDIFTSEFSLWEDTIAHYYHTVQEAFQATLGAHIMARDVLAPGVVQVTYSNNVSIIINYSQAAFRLNHLIVEAESFLVVREA